MDREQVFDRLLVAVLALKQNLEQKVKVLDEQVLQGRLESLKERLDKQHKELADWLSEIDRSLIDCCASFEEYQRLYTEVSVLNQKISQIAGAPAPMDSVFRADSIEEAIMARIQHLRAEGKI